MLDILDRQTIYCTSRTIRRLPNDLAITVRQLKRRINLVSMEVIKLLLLPFHLINPRQRRIATRLIQVQDALPCPSTSVAQLVRWAKS